MITIYGLLVIFDILCIIIQQFMKSTRVNSNTSQTKLKKPVAPKPKKTSQQDEVSADNNSIDMSVIDDIFKQAKKKKIIKESKSVNS